MFTSLENWEKPMSKYEKIKHLAAHEFRRITGVKIQTFNEMVAIIKEKELRKR
jgi:hypothetical protein